jgi:hypothetical protein
LLSCAIILLSHKQVDADSPGSAAGLLPYFDFLTEINGVQLVCQC